MRLITMEGDTDKPLTLKERVAKAVNDCIESAKAMQDPQFAGCYDEEVNQFYLDWDEWTTCGKTILGTSDTAVWFSPSDEFCPFCELEDIDVLFADRYEKLSITIHTLMSNALATATTLQHAIRDTWFQYMMHISPQILGAAGSYNSRSAGCRFDRPSITPNTLIDHFVTHLMPPHNILLKYTLQDAGQRLAASVPDNVFRGRATEREILRALQGLDTNAVAGIRKAKN